MSLGMYLDEFKKGEYDNYIQYLKVGGNQGSPVIKMNLLDEVESETDVSQLIYHLCELLKMNIPLKELHFNGYKIDIEGVRLISEALKSNTTLEELILDVNEIDAEGAVHISRALESNKTLKILGMWGNKIGRDGSIRLSKALYSNKSLKMINLFSNNIDDMGARALLQAITPESQLDEIDLRANSVCEAIANNTKRVIAFLKGIDEVVSVTTSILPQPIHEDLLAQYVFIPESSEIAKIVSDFMPEKIFLGEPLSSDESVREQQKQI